MSIRTRIQQHSYVIESVSTETIHLGLYALFAYMCGLDF